MLPSAKGGAATSAREAGFGNDEFMLLERWKSDSYRLSITTYPERILKRHGGTSICRPISATPARPSWEGLTIMFFFG